MKRKRISVDDRLEALSALELGSDPDEDRGALAAAIDDRHYRVVAMGADLAAERLHFDLVPPLIDAYRRLLVDPVKRDPSCHAKRAIVRALVTLECREVEFFLEGLRYRQLEPVWGGRADTAVDVRCSCAIGLINTGWHRALHELTPLLDDSEPRARVGAVRAIACGIPQEAELLLRFKVLIGDPELEVIGECFAGLLSVAPEESVALVARALAEGDAPVRELAALALGESRLPEALSCLREVWDEELPMGELRRALLRAAALHRSDAALDWLLSIVTQGDRADGEAALDALAIYRHNAELMERCAHALAQRGDGQLEKRFDELRGAQPS